MILSCMVQEQHDFKHKVDFLFQTEGVRKVTYFFAGHLYQHGSPRADLLGALRPSYILPLCTPHSMSSVWNDTVRMQLQPAALQAAITVFTRTGMEQFIIMKIKCFQCVCPLPLSTPFTRTSHLCSTFSPVSLKGLVHLTWVWTGNNFCKCITFMIVWLWFRTTLAPLW